MNILYWPVGFTDFIKTYLVSQFGLLSSVVQQHNQTLLIVTEPGV